MRALCQGPSAGSWARVCGLIDVLHLVLLNPPPPLPLLSSPSALCSCSSSAARSTCPSCSWARTSPTRCERVMGRAEARAEAPPLLRCARCRCCADLLLRAARHRRAAHIACAAIPTRLTFHPSEPPAGPRQGRQRRLGEPQQGGALFVRCGPEGVALHWDRGSVQPGRRLGAMRSGLWEAGVVAHTEAPAGARVGLHDTDARARRRRATHAAEHCGCVQLGAAKARESARGCVATLIFRRLSC